MSIAAKQIFLKSIEKEIADKVTAADSAAIMNCIYSELHKYDMEITIQETRKDETDDLLQAFIDAKNIEGRSEKTINHYRYVIQKMLSAVNVPTYQVSIYNLRSYMMQERNRGVSDRTLDGNRSVFCSFFGWLYKENLINENPCANLGAVKHTKKIRVPFSQVEIAMLKEACETARDKAMISFLLSTGCRISEVCQLNVDDIDFQNLECTVLGKGNKERTVFLDDITAMHLKKTFPKERTAVRHYLPEKDPKG